MSAPASADRPAELPSEPSVVAPRGRGACVMVGFASLLAGLALYASLASIPGANGWKLRRWSAPSFEGPPALVAVVPEPFEVEALTTPFAAEWDAWLRVDEPRRYEFTVEADDAVELAVDGKVVLDARRIGPRKSQSVTVRLDAGVHHTRLRLVDSGGGKFLRLFFASPDKDHGWMPYPWPRRLSFPTEAAARASGPTPSPVARAAAFGGALLLVLGGLAALAFGLLRAPPAADVAAGLALFLFAWTARLIGLPGDDLHSDEMAYLKAGMHYLRNAQVGDFTTWSFRHIMEHPPIAKWLYALAELAGGTLGAKLLASVLHSLTCVVVFAIGRSFASRAVGAGAAAMLAVMPYFLGHGRIIGLEAPLVFFFSLSALLLLLACERQSFRLHFAWGLTSILGVGSRATAVWFAPIALMVCIVALVRGQRRIRPYLGAFVGAGTGVLLVYAAWPWLWPDLLGQVRATYGHWAPYRPREWILGTLQHAPVWYYAFGFVAVSSAFVLLLAAAGVAGAVRRRTLLDWLLLGWLLFPFAQSIPSMRQDGARYVIQAFPALALLAALGAESVAAWLRRPRAGGFVTAGVCAYLAAVCVWMHPYQLDYCAEWIGGPGRVSEKRWLELPFWGEGQRELAEVVGRIAPPNARVWLFNVTADFPGLRPDLVRDDSPAADFLLANYFQYPRVPAGYERVHTVRAGGAELGGVYRKAR